MKLRELWDALREDRRRRNRTLAAGAVLVALLAWWSIWLLLVLVYIAGATAFLLRSELLRSTPGEDDDWF